MPAHLKDPEVRQRRNVKSESAELPTVNPDAEIPELPNPDGRTWHPLVMAWWTEVWQSPMAVKYLPTDARGLGRLAMLIQDFYLATKPSERRELSAEIRQQEARFGLSNLDRNRMDWTIGKAEPNAQAQSGQNSTSHDPRKVLKLA